MQNNSLRMLYFADMIANATPTKQKYVEFWRGVDRGTQRELKLARIFQHFVFCRKSFHELVDWPDER